jgi:hypothetical protein
MEIYDPAKAVHCPVCPANLGSQCLDETGKPIGHEVHAERLLLSQQAEMRLSSPDKKDEVNHPNHYGGDTVYETIKVIAAWNLGFLIGNCVKYLSRAGKKDPTKLVEDLEKARWYLGEAIKRLKAGEKLF